MTNKNCPLPKADVPSAAKRLPTAHWFCPVVVLSIVGMLSVAARAPADEPSGLKLLRGDSLAGWDYGDPPPRDWTIAEGVLCGSARSTPLLSGFSFGDFELRLQWSASGGGAWKLRLPEVPAGPGLELTLREGDGCGRLLDGGKELAPGGQIEPVVDGNARHAAVLRRSGEKLSLAVDGKPLCEATIGPDRRFGLGLAVADGEAALAELRVEEPSGEPIFNGRDFDGWWCPGKLDAWAAEDGELMLSKGGGNYVRTEKLYGNFTLSCEVKMKKGGNSGIGIRTPRDGWPSGDGMELQLLDSPQNAPPDRYSYMAIYGNAPPLGRADLSEQYNRIVIKADGRMVSAWVNGELVQQINTLDHPELEFRFPEGWIGFQDHGAWIRVRNIRVLEAPDGRGLDAWHRPKPLRGTVAVIDRLMNPERLALADGIASGTVSRTIDGDAADERVLAELAGPGAVVEIARSTDEGTLAFYFDGQPQPRIECKPGNLRRAVPMLVERTEPAPTCLTYEKSLKVVLRGAKQAAYRFDYVTFPKGTVVESYADPKSGFPHGWDSAALYRTHRYWVPWGGPREFDPLPKLQSEKKTIEPGRTEPMLRIDGAGVLQWTRLAADRRVLENDDLWLEATVDGEASPAVAAPVRFWFAGLIGGRNYENFAWTTGKGTLHSQLAMPFGNGITLALSNRGGNPIADVGLMASYAPAAEATQETSTQRMRLRGVFLPAEEGTDSLLDRQGAGRWIGLVCRPPEGETQGIAELRIDGKPAEGWAAPDFDLFLGRSGDFRAALAGREQGLCWRMLWAAPVEFRKSLVLRTTGKTVGDRLALFYLEKETP